jgi:FG-GAP-like repeat
MAKRRPRFDFLEARLCLTGGPTLQTTITLPEGAWEPTVYRASPLFVDIFGTGKDDLIAVASGAQLVAYQENADGSASPIIDYKVPSGINGLFADIKSTPIVVTDPTTGRQDLFAAMGRNESSVQPGGGPVIEDGRLFGWDLQTGNLLPGFANGVSTGMQYNGDAGVYGSLTSGDLQGNGIPDIVATSFGHDVTAVTLQGQILWQWDNDDSIISSAVVADIDRDGIPDVIVGGDSSANPTFNFQNGGWVTVLSNTGVLKWRKELPGEVTWSSPVVADLLGNGYLDIVIGTGTNFSQTLGGAYTQAGDYIYAFDPFGNMLPGWPYHTTFNGDTQPHEVASPLVVADLLGNGQLEVIAQDVAGYLHVIQPNGQDLPGFVGGVRIDPELTQAQTPLDYGSPVVADITGSGQPDIIASAGPYLNAFDAHGNFIPIGPTMIGAGNLPEGIDTAPAIGNFDGTGGLCLALETWDEDSPNGRGTPDKVEIYKLPQSTLAPPWPFVRRTVTGDAVARSPIYDQQYVTQAFNTLMGSVPGQATMQPYVAALNVDATNLLKTAQFIAISQPVEQAEVNRIYEAFLGRAADANAYSVWVPYLETHTYRQMESQVASSTEFATKAGGTVSGEITRLYEAILARNPSQGEINAWLSTKLPAGSIAAGILEMPEFINDQFSNIIQAMFGAGTQSLIPPDDEAAFSLDTHAGVSEAELISLTLTSAGNYAATNFDASYIANLYRDVLGRQGSGSDIAVWLTALDNGAVSVGGLASDFLKSQESKQDYAYSEYLGILGFAPDPTTLANLTALPNREDVLIAIIGSSQFYAKAGSTNAGFITYAFGYLDAVSVPASSLQAIEQQMAQGTTTYQVAAGIIYTGTLYFDTLVVNQLTRYIPSQSEGVLRTGELPVTAPGQPINPDPNLISYFLNLYLEGYSDTQVLSVMLSSPQYLTTVSFTEGIYMSPGIRSFS